MSSAYRGQTQFMQQPPGFGGMYGPMYGGDMYQSFQPQPMPQPNVNDLFGRYFSQQYYGGPSFNPFAATSFFGGGYGGGYGGGFGGGMRRDKMLRRPRYDFGGEMGQQRPWMPTIVDDTAPQPNPATGVMPSEPVRPPVEGGNDRGGPVQQLHVEPTMPQSYYNPYFGYMPQYGFGGYGGGY